MSDETVMQDGVDAGAVEVAAVDAGRPQGAAAETGPAPDAVVNNGGQDLGAGAAAPLPGGEVPENARAKVRGLYPDERDSLRLGNAEHFVQQLGQVLEISGRGLLINGRFAAGLGIKVVENVATIIGI